MCRIVAHATTNVRVVVIVRATSVHLTRQHAITANACAQTGHMLALTGALRIAGRSAVLRIPSFRTTRMPAQLGPRAVRLPTQCRGLWAAVRRSGPSSTSKETLNGLPTSQPPCRSGPLGHGDEVRLVSSGTKS